MNEVLASILGIGNGAVGTALTIGLFVLMGWLMEVNDVRD